MNEENKLVSYTIKNKTIYGMLVRVGSCKYILHNDGKFKEATKIYHAPWIKEFGETYKYYNSSLVMKNINISSAYELWD